MVVVIQPEAGRLDFGVVRYCTVEESLVSAPPRRLVGFARPGVSTDTLRLLLSGPRTRVPYLYDPNGLQVLPMLSYLGLGIYLSDSSFGACRQPQLRLQPSVFS